MLLQTFMCVLMLFGNGVRSSPFELLENYIDGFEKNLERLKRYLDDKPKLNLRNQIPIDVEVKEHKIKDIGEYDFIIIGGGTTGSVIASRLSEIPEWKILLLEAGELETTATKVPSMHHCLQSPASPFTWGYYSTPQNHSCLNMEEKRCFIPTAKALGGTTAINDMLYTRGNARDFDLWADTGLKGWCSTSLGPYFKNIEDAHLDTKMDHGFHHFGGPVHLESPRYHSDLAYTFMEGAKEIGLEEIDLNGKNSLGFGFPQLTTKNGQRLSAADAYLKPAEKRNNLDIKPLTQVTKILISEHTKEARGVHFLHDGELYAATANKEVILSAGTINSAKLLLLSGIGPHDELKHLKIEPIADLKVGQNLIHHIVFPGMTYIFNDTAHYELPFYYSKEIDYLRNGKGPLSSNGIDIIGFIKTEYAKGRHLYPDIELLVTSHRKEPPAKGADLRDKHEHLHSPSTRKLTINLILLHPKSRGTLTLHSHDPLSYPVIDLKDFSDPHDDDIETLLSGIKTVQRLLHTDPCQKLELHHDDLEIVRNCTAFDIKSDDYWKCAIKHLSFSSGEVTSSAPMGIEKDDGHVGDSVVDLQLRVHGVEKLRVADDSVIPVSISGHLAAVKMVIGEKCADLIKEEWSK